MKPYTKALIVLSLVTFSTYGVLVGVGVANLTFDHAGLKPFDLRPLGYTLEDAQIYIALLTPELVALYSGFLRRVDTVFSLLMGLWLGWCLWGVTRRLHPWSRVILLVVPASFTVMDLCENALISEMVQKNVSAVGADLVSMASSYTITKFVMLSVAFGLLLTMMVRNSGVTSKRREG